jgi:hypothetical protein
LLSDEFLARSRNQRRQALKAFRDAIVEAWTAMGFDVTSCISRDEHRFIELEMTYPTILEPHLLAAAYPRAGIGETAPA